jgi:KAP family P-loop domain
MKQSKTIFEELTGCRWQSRARYPGVIAALITAAVLIAADGSQALMDKLAGRLVDAFDEQSGQLKMLLAVLLVLTAIYFPSLVSWLKGVWKKLKDSCCGPVFVAIPVAIIFGHRSSCQEGLWVLVILLWALIYWMMHEQISRINKGQSIEDRFYRKYFVERLAEILSEEAPNAKRVAIMGPWGSGKTVVLDMLEDYLAQSASIPFCISRLNPWKCRTPEEAWLAFSKSIDDALGLSSVVPSKWLKQPILGWFIGLLPGNGVGRKLLDFFSEDAKGRSAHEIITNINRRIDSLLSPANARLLILVDDMERTDGAVLRSLFPVIDRLAELEKCYFVFGIDPDRVVEAFNEKGQIGTLTRGYLDKAFELQISLPEPRGEDLADWIQSQVDPKTSPKLSKAMPSLRKYLPQSPRQALAFLNLARSKEKMFLYRLDDKDFSATAFFLLCICDIEFPGLSRAFLDEKSIGFLEKIIFVQKDFSNENKDDQIKLSKSPEWEKLKNLLSELIGSGNLGTIWKNRIENLVEGLANDLKGKISWLSSSSLSYKLNFLISGYSMLGVLSPRELIELQGFWKSNAGRMSIGEIIFKFMPMGNHYDQKACASQFIKWEIDWIINVRRRSHDNNEVDLKAKFLMDDILALIQHLRFSVSGNESVDGWLFDRGVFYKWFEMYRWTPNPSIILPRIKICEKDEWRFSRNRVILVVSE